MDEDLVIRWNNDFPIDRWWRKKHGVPFGSQRHREISFFDQLFEFKEDKLFDDLIYGEKYEPDSGNIFKKSVMEELNKNKTIEMFKNAPNELI